MKPAYTSSHVFISHASQNHKLADEIRQHLEKLRIDCWIAPRDIPAGAQYGEEIVSAINRSLAVVLVLTSEANNSRAVANEVELAFRNSKAIIPIRITPIEPSAGLAFFINSVQWVDACATPLKSRVHEIARIVSALRENTAIPAPSPEQPTIAARLERRIEDLFRHKFLTVSIVLLLLGAISGVIYLNARDTNEELHTLRSAVDNDSSTFGLVTLASGEEVGLGKNAVSATIYVNLTNPSTQGLRWRWELIPFSKEHSPSGGGGKLNLMAAGVERFIIPVSDIPGTLTVCLTAIHPRLNKAFTADWSFGLTTENGSLLIHKNRAPRMMQTNVSECGHLSSSGLASNPATSLFD